ncbi:hypothetical protein [uncultured Spirosoma sp.]|uniref:hypothetical protein n=1 Tax=uncultured Spirosoma sp. TaxID=278208 RepID=UPI00258CA46F|nr:hypothetical protein [uncultured Spirosoma sp.]
MNNFLVIWSLTDPATTNSITPYTKSWWLWTASLSLIGLVFLLTVVLIMLIHNSDKIFSALVPEKRSQIRSNEEVHELLSESAKSSLY